MIFVTFLSILKVKIYKECIPYNTYHNIRTYINLAEYKETATYHMVPYVPYNTIPYFLSRSILGTKCVHNHFSNPSLSYTYVFLGLSRTTSYTYPFLVPICARTQIHPWIVYISYLYRTYAVLCIYHTYHTSSCAYVINHMRTTFIHALWYP